MTTNLHDKMLAAIDAYFSASDGDERDQAEEQLLDVRDELRKHPVRELTNDDLEEIARQVLAQGYKHRDFEVRFARAVINATLGRTA